MSIGCYGESEEDEWKQTRDEDAAIDEIDRRKEHEDDEGGFATYKYNYETECDE